MKKVRVILSVALITTILLSCNGSAQKERAKSSKESAEANKSFSSVAFVTIGNQIWMTKNLNVDKFRNGDPIRNAKTAEEWEKAGKNEEPAWCYNNNDPTNGENFGKLYNWYAVNDPRGLAPEGMKIPSKEDWCRLIEFLGGKDVAGKKMKFTKFWDDNDGLSGNGSNESGFFGLPSGFRYHFGEFQDLVKSVNWWSSTIDDENGGTGWGVSIVNGELDESTGTGYFYNAAGLSVRCLRE
jgi:uncharacterized protein (TIGR02145 family)